MYHCIRSSGAYCKLTTIHVLFHKIYNYSTPAPILAPISGVFFLQFLQFTVDSYFPFKIFAFYPHSLGIISSDISWGECGYSLEPHPWTILVTFSVHEITKFN